MTEAEVSISVASIAGKDTVPVCSLRAQKFTQKTFLFWVQN